MPGPVWWAVAIVMATGMAGVVLFIATKRGHAERESMQLAANIAGLLGVALAAAALIYGGFEIAQEGNDNSDNGIRAEHLITITNGAPWNLDGVPPYIDPGNSDLFYQENPEGIGGSGSARIVAWSEAGTPDRDKCSAKLSGMKPEAADNLVAPQIGDLFCVHTRGKNPNSMHYAYGEVVDVRPGEYAAWIVVWTNP